MFEALRISDPDSGAQAQIAPGLGFNCFAFSAVCGGETIEVIDSPEDVLAGNARPSGFGIPILFPFPNRIRAGTYEWEGCTYHVPLPEGRPDAIHGFCYDRSWRIVEKTEDSLTGQFQLSLDDPGRLACWPADFLIEVRYRVTENRLETRIHIHNPSDLPLPWGLGTHPYFRVPLGSGSRPEDCVFSVPVNEEWELEETLPTGRRLPVETRDLIRTGVRCGERSYDNVFTGWDSDGGTVRCSLMDERAGIEIMQVCDGLLFREAVVFTPPGRNAVCLEPYTCVTDAVNLHARDLNTGLNVLPPGESIQTWIAIQAGPIVV